MLSSLVSKYHVKHSYTLLVGVVFQIIGVALFIHLPNSTNINPAEYGCQVLLGVGLGINTAILVNSVPFMVEKPLIGKRIAIVLVRFDAN